MHLGLFNIAVKPSKLIQLKSVLWLPYKKIFSPCMKSFHHGGELNLVPCSGNAELWSQENSSLFSWNDSRNSPCKSLVRSLHNEWVYRLLPKWCVGVSLLPTKLKQLHLLDPATQEDVLSQCTHTEFQMWQLWSCVLGLEFTLWNLWGSHANRAGRHRGHCRSLRCLHIWTVDATWPPSSHWSWLRLMNHSLGFFSQS